MLVELWNEEKQDIDSVLKMNSSHLTYSGFEVIDSTSRQWNQSRDHFVAKYTSRFSFLDYSHNFVYISLHNTLKCWKG